MNVTLDARFVALGALRHVGVRRGNGIELVSDEWKSQDAQGPSWLPHLLAAILLAAAFSVALATTTDVSWPPRADFAREMGSAHAVLAGRALDDPAYLGEGRWYNPLLGHLVAAGSWLLDRPVHETITRLGPFGNLLTPIGLYLLACLLFGRWVALAALAVFLFAHSPRLPAGVEASYSPWLWTRNFMQGPSLLTACAIITAFRRRRLGWDLLAGVMLGLVFLGHTAPALILTLFTILLAAQAARSRDGAQPLREASTRLAIIGAAAFLVSLPFLWPLFERYRFRILNRAPLDYVGLPIRSFLNGVFSLRFVAGLLGLWALRYERRRVEFLLLFVAALTPLGYGLFQQAVKHVGVSLPLLLPTHNYHHYFSQLLAILAGLGFGWLARVLARRFKLPRFAGLPAEQLTLLLLLALIVGGQIATYTNSYDLVEFRQEAIDKGRRRDMVALHEWLLANTTQGEVVLTDDWFAHHAVVSAARKVVATLPGYSNPYVPIEPRRSDRDRLFEQLRSGDTAAFLALAHSYGVDYVAVAEASEECCRLERVPTKIMQPVMRAEGITLYRLRGAPVGADGT